MAVKTIYKNNLSPLFLKQLSEYLANGFSTDSPELWRSRLDFWWKSNPYLTDNIPIGWIITDNDTEQIRGFMGNLPVMFMYAEDRLRAVAAAAWYVSEEFSQESASLYLMFNRQKDVDIYLNTTPSVSVQNMLIGIGCRKIGSRPHLDNYMIIVNPQSFSSLMSFLLKKFSESEIGLKKNLFYICSRIGKGSSKILPKPKQSQIQAYNTEGRYTIQLCENSSSFLKYLTEHKRENTIELSKDKTTLDWILFSPEVQVLLHRKTEQIFTKDGTYCGYIIYDYQHVGAETTLRIRELQLLKPENAIVKLIIKHLKIEARNAGCAAIYSGLLAPDPELDRLLHKNIRLSLKTKNRYFVKFRKNVITDVDPYAIYVPSDLDPDQGFL